MVDENKENQKLNLDNAEDTVSEVGETEEPEVLIDQCEQLLEEKDKEIQRLQDRALRLAAEMENTRKRLEREKSEGIAYANEYLLKEMLSVADNLERAVQHAETGADYDSLLEGMRMILKGFWDSIAKFGCTPFDSLGCDFDPNLHEAVMQQEAANEPENKVLQELQRGYKLHDRLLRPAMVVVSKAAN